MLKLNRIYKTDCIGESGMCLIPDKSIDMILCDLPYGTTACKWDAIIPFDKLWEQYRRVIKDNGAIVLTASQPFTSALLMSNPDEFRYEWIWEKSKASNFMSVKNQPLKNHESVLIFSKKKINYSPQMVQGEPYKARPGKKQTEVYNPSSDLMFRNGSSDGMRYPKSIVYFKTAEAEGKVFHPTQKPVALFEYFIKTYSEEGQIVLDNCSGSGTTAIAAINTKRKFICMENDDVYHPESIERLNNHQPPL